MGEGSDSRRANVIHAWRRLCVREKAGSGGAAKSGVPSGCAQREARGNCDGDIEAEMKDIWSQRVSMGIARERIRFQCCCGPCESGAGAG